MQRSTLTSGNALLIALFVGVLMMTLVFVQVVATRSHLDVTERRTQNAQMAVEATFLAPRTLHTVARSLSADATALGAAPLASGQYARQLGAASQAWLPCEVGRTSFRLFVAQEASCATAGPQPLPITSDRIATPTGETTRYRVPLLLRLTNRSGDGQRTRVASGELQMTGATNLNISALHLLAGDLGSAVPGRAIFDGPVHINAAPWLAGGRSEWPGGLTTASDHLRLGTQQVSVDQFAPNPVFPCDQSAATCPNFAGGLGMASVNLGVPDATSTGAGLQLPATIREVVLFPDGGSTGFFACTATSCDVYTFRGGLRRIRSSQPRPDKTGGIFETTPLENVPVSGASQPMIVAPGQLTVRALTPTGAAYSGPLSVVAGQSLTVASSLLAQTPVCTTYPVVNAGGSFQPAACGGLDSPDGLGLVSRTGNIVLGDRTQPLLPDERSLSLQANLLASRGEIRIADDRLTTVDWIGAAAARSFVPDERMRLAHDPRALALPGFPALPGGLTPARLRFDVDRALD